MISFRSNYKATIDELVEIMESNQGKFNANQNNLWPITYFYAGNLIDELPSNFMGEIIFYNDKIKSDYIVIDWRQYIPGKNDLGKLSYITRNYSPIIKKYYNGKAYPIWNYHRYYDFKRIPKLFESNINANNISVYDLRKSQKI